MIKIINVNPNGVIEYSATEQSDIANLPTNVESTSTCQLITDSGLTVYMFRKTGEKTGKWVAI